MLFPSLSLPFYYPFQPSMLFLSSFLSFLANFATKRINPNTKEFYSTRINPHLFSINRPTLLTRRVWQLTSKKTNQRARERKSACFLNRIKHNPFSSSFTTNLSCEKSDYKNCTASRIIELRSIFRREQWPVESSFDEKPRSIVSRTARTWIYRCEHERKGRNRWVSQRWLSFENGEIRF